MARFQRYCWPVSWQPMQTHFHRPDCRSKPSTRCPLPAWPIRLCKPPYNESMVVAGRRKSVALFIALGIGLISVILLLYIGWVLLQWRTGLLLVLGVLLLALLIAGVVLNTI